MKHFPCFKIIIVCCFWLTSLVGCGESGSKDNTEPSTVNGPENTSNNQSDTAFIPHIIDFDYQPKYRFLRLAQDQVVEEQMINGSGEILFPNKQVIERGNLKISVANIEDPDGIGRVLLGFNDAERAMVVCDEYCPSPLSFVQTGINPFNFNQMPGNITLQVWVEDVSGHLTMIAAQQVNWIPESVVVEPPLRTESGEVTLSWQKTEKAIRYNVYLASMLISDVRLIDSMPDKQKAIAQAETSWSFSGLDPQKNYYAKVTAIDGSGESAFSDNILLSATDIVMPVANSDTFFGLKLQAISGNVLENDQDFGLGPLTVQTPALIPPKNGDLELLADGSFTYFPRSGFYGSDSFVYVITNMQGATAQAVVSLEVVKDNQAPVALTNKYATAINNALEVKGLGLIGNDVDFDGDILVIKTTPVTNVQHGSLILNSDGTFSYTPNTDFVGEDSFEYELVDNKGGSSTASVSIKVQAVLTNIPPVALSDSFETSEDIMLNVQSPGICANDSDIMIDTGNVVNDPSYYSQISILEPTKNGTLMLTGEGSFQYMPNENYYGQDTFLYEITDLDGESAIASVVLNVTAINDAPIAMDDFSQVAQGEPVAINVLNNDLDIDGTLNFSSVNVVDAPKFGTVTINSSSGQMTYQSDANYTGEDHYVYSVFDNDGAESNTAFVYITVTGENAGPSALSFGLDTPQEQSVDIDLSEKVTDPDGINFNSLTVFNGPSHGELTMNAVDLVVTYTPESGFYGLDQFNYTVEDTLGSVSNIATVAVSVIQSNIPPVAVNDNAEVTVGSAVTINVLQNDFDDIALDPTTVEIVSSPSFGSAVVQPNGTILYTHNTATIGSDGFSYKVKDSEGVYSNIAFVSMIVKATMPRPISALQNSSAKKVRSNLGGNHDLSSPFLIR